MSPKISIIHPSLGRPSLAFEAANKWINNCHDKSNIEYILILSCGDILNPYIELFEELSTNPWFKIVYMEGIPTAGKKVNEGAKEATGNIFICISDDVVCLQDWDKLLLDALEGKEDYVVKCPDGIQPYLMTMPLMDRKFYNRFGYILNPEYHHWYCDNELSAIGAITGRTINLDIMFEHLHYSVGKGVKRDNVNELNESKAGQDAELFAKRQAMNFGL